MPGTRRSSKPRIFSGCSPAQSGDTPNPEPSRDAAPLLARREHGVRERFTEKDDHLAEGRVHGIDDGIALGRE